jgi:5-methylcytosine-specific restriction protein A
LPKQTCERLFALDVYQRTRPQVPSPADPSVIELSETLRALPYHEENARRPTFRNPDGVAFKIQNLRSVDTGKGLGNVSNTDRMIWQEFGARPAEVGRLAALIRQSLKSELSRETEPELDDEEFYEGRQLTRLHYIRERNAKVRAKLLSARRDAGGLACDICGCSYAHLPADLKDAAFEGHHVIPIAQAGERATRIADMALLCASCHRLLHRAIARGKAWLSVADARSLLAHHADEP